MSPGRAKASTRSHWRDSTKRSSIWRGNGGRNDLGYVHVWRAQALAHLGRYDEARLDIASARAEYLRTGQQTGLVDLAYAEGAVEMADPHATQGAAMERLCAAAGDARAQNLRLLELRATMKIAEIMRADGRFGQAASCLGPVVEGIAEGHDCAQLIEARDLLLSFASLT